MNEKIYPILPTAPGSTPNEYTELTKKVSSDFRLTKINEIEKYLEQQSEMRRNISKKYRRANKIVDSADGVLCSASLGLGIGGIALLTTVIAAPTVLVMEIASVGTGFLTVLAKFVNKKLKAKEEKHRMIHMLAESKLNTIHSHISKAIEDGDISDEEFKLILEEAEKYRLMKDDIRRNTSKKLREGEKESLIERGKNDLRMKFENFYKSEIAKIKKI